MAYEGGSQLFGPVAESVSSAAAELADGALHVASVLGEPVVAETLFALAVLFAVYKYRAYKQE